MTLNHLFQPILINIQPNIQPNNIKVFVFVCFVFVFQSYKLIRCGASPFTNLGTSCWIPYIPVPDTCMFCQITVYTVQKVHAN